MNGREVQPQYEGQNVTWKDVTHAIRPLWSLQYKEDEYQNLYTYLQMMKNWRNAEVHISPTASEQEVDVALKVAITMYFYASDTCIKSLRFADLGEDRPMRYRIHRDENAHMGMAAEDVQN